MGKKFDRRSFLKTAVLSGAGLAGLGLTGLTSGDTSKIYRKSRIQRFNMNGYGASKLDTVRVGLIGVGNRGFGGLGRLSRIEGVEITAVCDVEPERARRGIERLDDTKHDPREFSGSEDAWRKLCESDDVDLVYICTPWHLHAPQCIYAMENGKHAATELPAAVSMDECWQLVETSERTRKHCMMLGNVCYDFFEMMVINMARQGYFGDIIHTEGAYIHELIAHNFSKTVYHDMWRLEENIGQNGNLYPPHAIGPLAKLLNINAGDRMEYLVSMSSHDFNMNKRAKELAEEDPFYDEYVDRDYRGNMNTVTIKTRKGKTIMLQHDVSSPRPYSRIFLVSGSDGTARKWPAPARISTSHHGWLSQDEMKEIEEQYTPEITKRVGEMARQVGGHGGMDTIMDWRLIDCLRNGIPLDMDVYDAALWSAIGPLSIWSAANRSNSVDVPDFTAGNWKTNEPGLDLNLERGGNTAII